MFIYLFYLWFGGAEGHFKKKTRKENRIFSRTVCGLFSIKGLLHDLPDDLTSPVNSDMICFVF